MRAALFAFYGYCGEGGNCLNRNSERIPRGLLAGVFNCTVAFTVEIILSLGVDALFYGGGGQPVSYFVSFVAGMPLDLDKAKVLKF